MLFPTQSAPLPPSQAPCVPFHFLPVQPMDQRRRKSPQSTPATTQHRQNAAAKRCAAKHHAGNHAPAQLCGAAFRQDLADLLRVEGRPCATILRRFVEEGKVVRVGQIYRLPPEKV